MDNRLQFRHHDQVFDTREAAIEYIQSQIRFAEDGLAKDDPSYGFSLLAEPTVLLYKKEEDETDPHLMLVLSIATIDSVLSILIRRNKRLPTLQKNLRKPSRVLPLSL